MGPLGHLVDTEWRTGSTCPASNFTLTGANYRAHVSDEKFSRGSSFHCSLYSWCLLGACSGWRPESAQLCYCTCQWWPGSINWRPGKYPPRFVRISDPRGVSHVSTHAPTLRTYPAISCSTAPDTRPGLLCRSDLLAAEYPSSRDAVCLAAERRAVIDRDGDADLYRLFLALDAPSDGAATTGCSCPPLRVDG